MVAEAAIRLKKHRLGTGGSAADAADPTPPVAAPHVPALCVEDLKLLGRACVVPEDPMRAMDRLPTPRIDPVD